MSDAIIPEKQPVYDTDPFCKALFDSFAPQVRDSFSEAQVSELVKSLTRMTGRRHWLDFRFSVSLFFARYYVLMLAGPDRRSYVQATLADRRRRGLHAGAGATLGILFFMGLCTLTVTSVLTLYLLKTLAGIDLLPDSHLWDLLSGLFQPSSQPASQIANSSST